jgi:hypothetical protein
MNQLMLLVVALALFVYFGGSNVPSVLKQNKELLLGVVVGLVLCSFMGLRLEGVVNSPSADAGGQAPTPVVSASLGQASGGISGWGWVQSVFPEFSLSAGGTDTACPNPPC